MIDQFTHYIIIQVEYSSIILMQRSKSKMLSYYKLKLSKKTALSLLLAIINFATLFILNKQSVFGHNLSQNNSICIML